MTAWRDRAAPMIASLQAALHEIQSQGAEIGRRVIEALRPVSTAVTALNSQLASLDDLARAPVDVSTEAEAAAAPSEADDVMELPSTPPAATPPTGSWSRVPRLGRHEVETQDGLGRAHRGEHGLTIAFPRPVGPRSSASATAHALISASPNTIRSFDRAASSSIAKVACT